MKPSRTLAALTATGAIVGLSLLAAPAQAATVPMGDACTLSGSVYCGTVRTHARSRGSSIAVKNWKWSQSAVTAKSVAANNRFSVPIRGTSRNYWLDTDGVIARPECTTTVWKSNQWGMFWSGTLTPGWAYKIADNEVWTVSNNGPNCRG